MDIRKKYFQESQSQQQRFGIGSPAVTPTTAKATTSIVDSRNVLFGTPSKEPISLVANRFGSFPLSPLGLPPRAPVLANKEQNRVMDVRPKIDGANSKTGSSSDAEDTATTASVTTSVSSPTPSYILSSSSSPELAGGAGRIEFDLEHNEALPDWMARPDNRESGKKNPDVIDAHREGCRERLTREAEEFRADDDLFGDTDGEDDDICSCCTPVLKNTTSRPQQVFLQRQQSFANRNETSTMTTTTTETTTTTTTTTQTTTSSSVNTSESVSSTTIDRTIGNSDIFLPPHLFSEMNGGHESDLVSRGTPAKSCAKNADVVTYDNHEMCSAVATATSKAVADPSRSCKSCAAKRRIIREQRKEMKEMKVMMKKLCMLLAETVRDQQNSGSIGDGDVSKLLASEALAPMAITDGSSTIEVDPVAPPNSIHSRSVGSEIVPMEPSNSTHSRSLGSEIVPAPPPNSTHSRSVGSEINEEAESSSVATSATAITSSTASTSSSSASSTRKPLVHGRRIASLPVTSVGKNCPRIRNERIEVSGQWGTYSGPTLSCNREEQDSTESKKESESDDDESPEAGILLGCVVRMDDTSLYVGSLSRNDTGSYIFHPPGTIYDSDGKPMRRIR